MQMQKYLSMDFCLGLAAWHIGKGHFTIGSNDDKTAIVIMIILQ
jgi:hypothetical protein